MIDKGKINNYVLGLILCGALIGFVWLSLVAGNGFPRKMKSYSLIFNSALGLTKDNAVMIAGVKIGHVSSIVVLGKQAQVDVELNADLQLFTDTKASIKSKTMLGEKYIALDPGNSTYKKLNEGAILKDNPPNIEVDQLMRDGSKLLSSIQQILLPLENNVEKFDALIKATDSDQFSSSLAFTITEAGRFMKDLRAVLNESSPDMKELLKESKEQAPQFFSSLKESTVHANRLLNALESSKVADAFKKIDPTLTQSQLMIKDIRQSTQKVDILSQRFNTLLIQLETTLARSDQVTERSIREILQEEGIRVNLIGNPKVQDRLRQLRNAPAPLPIP